jgi:hypothetical protein
LLAVAFFVPASASPVLLWHRKQKSSSTGDAGVVMPSGAVSPPSGEECSVNALPPVPWYARAFVSSWHFAQFGWNVDPSLNAAVPTGAT